MRRWNEEGAGEQRKNGGLGACPISLFEFMHTGTSENVPFQIRLKLY